MSNQGAEDEIVVLSHGISGSGIVQRNDQDPPSAATIGRQSKPARFMGCFSSILNGDSWRHFPQVGAELAKEENGYVILSFDVGSFFLLTTKWAWCKFHSTKESPFKQPEANSHVKLHFLVGETESVNKKCQLEIPNLPNFPGQGPRSVNNFVAIEFEIPKSLREAKSYVSSKTDFFLKENTLDLMSRGLHRSRSWLDHSMDQPRLQLKKALFKDVVSLYGPKDVGLDMPSCLSTSPHVLGSNHAILTLFSQAQTQNVIAPGPSASKENPSQPTQVITIDLQLSDSPGQSQPTNQTSSQVTDLPQEEYITNEESLVTCRFCECFFRQFWLKVLHYKQSRRCINELQKEFLRAKNRQQYSILRDNERENLTKWEVDLWSANPLINETNAKKVLKCKCATSLTFPSTMNYVLHREAHHSQPSESCERPLYPCPLCCKIFTQASVFSTHKCFSVEQREMRKQKLRNNVAATSTSVYHKVHRSILVKILSCRVCNQQLDYATGLIKHIEANTSCYEKLINGTSPHAYEVFNSIGLSGPYACEICGIQLNHPLGYILHKDHHLLPDNSRIQCKKCDKIFSKPCTFYNHDCQKPQKTAYCYFCVELDSQQSQQKDMPVIASSASVSPAMATTGSATVVNAGLPVPSGMLTIQPNDLVIVQPNPQQVVAPTIIQPIENNPINPPNQTVSWSTQNSQQVLVSTENPLVFVQPPQQLVVAQHPQLHDPQAPMVAVQRVPNPTQPQPLTSKSHDPSSLPELRHILSGSAVPNEQILLANLRPEPEFVSASSSTNLHSAFHSASSRHIRRHGLAGKSNQETVDLMEEEVGDSSMEGVVIPTLSQQSSLGNISAQDIADNYEAVVVEEPTSTTSLGEEQTPDTLATNLEGGTEIHQDNSEEPAAPPEIDMPEWKQYLLFNCYCVICSKVIESSKMWRHFQTEPEHTGRVKPLEFFNSFKVVLKEDSAARRKAKAGKTKGFDVDAYPRSHL